MHQKRNGGISLLFYLLLLGCGSSKGHIDSFEGLTSDYEGRRKGNLNQFAVMSVAGLLPTPMVGTVHHSVPKRKPSSFIGFSGEDKTYVGVSTYAPDSGTDIGRIRNLIDTLKAEVAEQLTAVFDRRVAYASRDAAKVRDAEAVLVQARQDVQAAYRLVSKELEKRNLIIFRWAVEERSESGLKLGGLFSASGSRDVLTEGYVVVSGLRIETIYFGTQWQSHFAQSSDDRDTKMVTYQVFAGDMAYSASEFAATEFAARLKASADELKNSGETLTGGDRVEIEYAISRISSLENLGRLSGVKRTYTELQKPHLTQATMGARDGWMPFFSVDTQLSELEEMEMTRASQN